MFVLEFSLFLLYCILVSVDNWPILNFIARTNNTKNTIRKDNGENREKERRLVSKKDSSVCVFTYSEVSC